MRQVSVSQESMWLLHRMAPESAAYNIVLAVRLHDPVDTVALGEAVRELITRHAELRARFDEVDGQPRKWLTGGGALAVRPVEWATDTELSALIRDVATVPFDLTRDGVFRAVLLRRESGDGVLVLVTHHIVADASSQWLLARDLLRTYAGRGPALPEPLTTYDEFVVEQRRENAEAERYWLEVCAGAEVARLPATGTSIGAGRGAAHQMAFPPDIAAESRATCRRLSVTPPALLAGAFHALLHRHSGQRGFLVGCAVSVRTGRALRDVVGCLANTVVLRADLTPETTFAQAAGQAGRRLVEGRGYLGYPYARLRLACRARGLPEPACRIGFTALSTDLVEPPLPMAGPGAVQGAEIEWHGLRLSLVDVPQMEGQFDLGLEVRYGRSGLNLVLKYDPEVLTAGFVERFAAQLRRFIELAVSAPETTIGSVPLVAERDVARLLAMGTGARRIGQV